MAGIEKKLFLERRDLNQLRVDAATKAFQGGQRCGSILVRAGNGFQEGVVAREDRRRARDLLVALLDQFFENLRAGAQAKINLRKSVLAIRVPDDEISRALQEGEERDQREEEPAPETAEVKPQG